MTTDHEYEFMGPVVGPVAIMALLPLVCYGLVYICNADGCLNMSLSIPGFARHSQLISTQGTLAILGWMAFQTLLHLLLPGQRVQGVLLANGRRLTYKLNGEDLPCLDLLQACLQKVSHCFSAAQINLVVTILAAAVFSFWLKLLPLSWIYDNFLPLLTADCIVSVMLSAYLYVTSFGASKLLATGGQTDAAIYNFFIGRELNPRLGSFDLKHFCELYPGLIGWVIIDLGMLQKQYEQLGYVSAPMLLVCTFQFIYVCDAIWFEKAILSTMDIVHDGFGFMLIFGDLVWVPFTYSLQARYLVDHSQVQWPQLSALQ